MSGAIRRACAGGFLALAVAACGAKNTSVSPPPTAGSGGTIDTGSGSGGQPGSGGSNVVVDAGPSADGSGAAISGGGGGSGNDAGSMIGGGGGGAAPDAAGDTPAAGGPFACSEMIGLWVMSQWWDPFEKIVDAAAWQYIFVHHGYLETWADPTSAYWATTTISPCAQKAGSPDRVIFLPFSLTLNTEEQWQTNLSKVVDAIKTKFPGVKRIEFISTIRSPNNQTCANDNDPNVVVPAYVDQAIQTVASTSGGLVTVGPKIEVANCSWWAGGTDLTGAGNTGIGQLYGAYYKEHP
ncbi:MAG TPA: hypothetical protein VH374_23175 [Polyangia bacterium]|nr:hypothetical protein [Polyangia bacterium]